MVTEATPSMSTAFIDRDQTLTKMKALAQKKRLPTNNKNSFTSATRDQTTRLPSDCSLDEPRRHTRIIRRCIETFGKPIFRPVIPLYARLMKPPRSSSRLRPMTLLPALRLTATPTESSAGNWRGARTRRGRHGARAQWGFRLGARGSSGGAARDYLRFYHADSSQYLVSVFGGGRPRKRPMGAVPRWGSAVEVDGLLSSVTHRAGIGAWIQQNVQLEVPSSRWERALRGRRAAARSWVSTLLWRGVRPRWPSSGGPAPSE